MNTSWQGVQALGLSLFLAATVQAQPFTSLYVAAQADNPYNSPIRRANPNSRQGSVPAMPPVPAPSTQPNPRPPTLENRGIGNGDNLRREQQVPNLEPSRPPRDSTRAP
ncbi:hypothetical protein GCM10009504_37020 [Pseudomonas laurentiana]|uniref:Lipoprotein n=1 Tax=Pseudomonas laurentiana TaxID=2364649 RepID=A0A6I5RPP7_9PSED|nr:hypothetical protein [Pseudomonas laurentiana]NES09715.1 hypothetical protein [Pseudomonas laurentiana]GGU76518.1 hypothetical protein GCM10009504_37020 [Pseudomonas laurentiana]